MERADAQKERDLQFVFLQARDMYSLSIHAYTADCSRKAPMPISPSCELDDQIALEVRKACVVDSYPYLWRHEASFFYVGLLFAGEDRFFLLGPILSAAQTNKEIFDYSNRYLHPAINDIPILSVTRLFAYLQTFCFLICGREYTFEYLRRFNSILTDIYLQDWISHRLDDAERYRLNYEYERKWLERFRTGTLTMDPSIKPSDTGKLAKEPYKNMEYMFVTAITLISRTAIQSGLSPEDSYVLSDVTFQQLAECSTIEELQNVYRRAISQYSYEIRRMQKGRSTLTMQCKQYVNQHLYDKLSVENIARELGAAPNFLSHKFAATEGMTLTAYIRERRMDRASELLRYSNASIWEIAQKLGFCSQSYFGKRFKAQFSMSPQAYRDHYALNPATKREALPDD